jgi:hypothetical protein
VGDDNALAKHEWGKAGTILPSPSYSASARLRQTAVVDNNHVGDRTATTDVAAAGTKSRRKKPAYASNSLPKDFRKQGRNDPGTSSSPPAGEGEYAGVRSSSSSRRHVGADTNAGAGTTARSHHSSPADSGAEGHLPRTQTLPPLAHPHLLASRDRERDRSTALNNDRERERSRAGREGGGWDSGRERDPDGSVASAGKGSAGGSRTGSGAGHMPPAHPPLVGSVSMFPQAPGGGGATNGGSPFKQPPHMLALPGVPRFGAYPPFLPPPSAAAAVPVAGAGAGGGAARVPGFPIPPPPPAMFAHMSSLPPVPGMLPMGMGMNLPRPQMSGQGQPAFPSQMLPIPPPARGWPSGNGPTQGQYQQPRRR